MKRLIPLLALTLTACTTSKPPTLSSGPVTIQGFDALGNPTSTSYAGRTAAGNGQVNDTTEAEILLALAAKLEGREFTYASATRSAIEQPNVSTDAEIEIKHKAALNDLATAAVSGVAGDYSKAISEVASLGGQLFAARAARANAPKSDSGAITTRVLSSGQGHGLVAASLGKEFGETLRAGQRASYSAKESTKSTDATGPSDIAALADAMRAARLQVEAARTNIPQVIQVPVPMPTPIPAPVSTNVVETIELPVTE